MLFPTICLLLFAPTDFGAMSLRQIKSISLPSPSNQVTAKAYPSEITSFQPDYAGGLKIANAIKSILLEECLKVGSEVKLSTAIAFPEMTRYNMVKDLVETKTLEAAYVKGGALAADFSIGYFQMKPSFVEYLESQIPELTIKNSKTHTAERQIRLQRLKSVRWQCRYLAHFTRFAEAKFERKDVTFLASAYNLGPMKEAAAIEAWIGVEAFPFGKKFKGKQIAYAKIADVFIQQYADTIFK